MAPSAKEKAAEYAVEKIASLIDVAVHDRGYAVFGVGTGSTVCHVMRLLGNHVAARGYASHQLIGVPTSAQAASLVIDAGMALGSLLQHPHLDFGFDGADEVDASGRFLIKGGGGAHFSEKLVAAACKTWIVVIDDSKFNDRPGHLGCVWKSVPLAIFPEAVTLVKAKLQDVLGLRLRIRESTAKMGPTFSDQGFILADAELVKPIEDVHNLADMLSRMPGVIEHGIFCDMASHVIIASSAIAKEISPSS